MFYDIKSVSSFLVMLAEFPAAARNVRKHGLIFYRKKIFFQATVLDCCCSTHSSLNTGSDHFLKMFMKCKLRYRSREFGGFIFRQGLHSSLYTAL